MAVPAHHIVAPTPRRVDNSVLDAWPSSGGDTLLDDPVLGPDRPHGERRRKTSGASRTSSRAPPPANLKYVPTLDQLGLPPRRRERTASKSYYSDASATSTVRSGRVSPRDALFSSQNRLHSIDAILSGTESASRRHQRSPVGPSPTSASSASQPQHDSLAKRWVRWMHKSRMAHLATPVAIGAAVIVRLAVGLGSFSGYRSPPLHGDFEAQRHWMSLAVHVPIERWYTHDLAYWGLDYPPLTAYHSWVMGTLAERFGDPSWVALRGAKSVVASEDAVKVFMRTTAILSEFVLYVPVVALGWIGVAMAGKSIASGRSRRSGRTQSMAVLAILFQPALILIDHGHFQYNSVMLGLAALSLVLLHKGRDLLAAAVFVLAMCYKQMAIYYAPAFFAYLLGRCFHLGQRDGLNLFFNLAFVSIATLALVFAPFLSPPSLALQAISRIFPFARGLFEDKVANFWCALNVFVKVRTLASIPALVRLALAVTVLALLPGTIGLIYVTAKRGHAALPLMPHALFGSAMAFFLFSFQVHEKTILLPLLPLTLLAADKEPGASGADWEWSALLNNVAMFSMWPLLKRDGLGLQYAVVTLFWNRLIGYDVFALPTSFVKVFSLVVYSAIAILHALEAVATPPAHLPDLFVVLNVELCAVVFGMSFLWSLTRLAEESWALVGGLGADANPAPRSEASLSLPPSPARSVRSDSGRRSVAGSAKLKRRNSGRSIASAVPEDRVWSDAESIRNARSRSGAPSSRLHAPIAEPSRSGRRSPSAAGFSDAGSSYRR